MTLQTGKRKRRNKKGFLLLEVLVSVALLSFGLVLIMNTFTRSLRSFELSDNYFRANLLLSKKLFEIENYPEEFLEEGQSDGSFEDFGGKFSWWLEVKKIEEEKLNEVKLKVLWLQNRKEEALTIATYYSNV